MAIKYRLGNERLGPVAESVLLRMINELGLDESYKETVEQLSSDPLRFPGRYDLCRLEGIVEKSIDWIIKTIPKDERRMFFKQSGGFKYGYIDLKPVGRPELHQYIDMYGDKFDVHFVSSEPADLDRHPSYELVSSRLVKQI